MDEFHQKRDVSRNCRECHLLKCLCLPNSRIVQCLIILVVIFWEFRAVPAVIGVPITSMISMGNGYSRLEQSTYDLQQPSDNRDFSGMHRDVGLPSQKSDIFPRRNLWELISSSSDVIPFRSNFNNGSINYSPWSSGPSASALSSPQQSVKDRLQKLEHHFNSLRVYDDDCRQRLLCEIAESPTKFVPLTNAFLDETSFNGDEKSLATKLLETNDGTKLLTYIEAAQRGISRQGCEIWTYRCPLTATSMIDFKALLVWREVSKWLTVKFVAKKHQK